MMPEAMISLYPDPRSRRRHVEASPGPRRAERRAVEAFRRWTELLNPQEQVLSI